MKWYIEQAQREFARFGFIGSPLTTAQLAQLYNQNIKLDEAYAIGCDVAAGIEFGDAVLVNALTKEI